MRFANETFEKRSIVKKKEAKKVVDYFAISSAKIGLNFSIKSIQSDIVFNMPRAPTGRGSENQLPLAITISL